MSAAEGRTDMVTLEWEPSGIYGSVPVVTLRGIVGEWTFTGAQSYRRRFDGRWVAQTPPHTAAAVEMVPLLESAVDEATRPRR